jgi:hypothetical protein
MQKCARCMTAMIKAKCFSENNFFLFYLQRDNFALIEIPYRNLRARSLILGFPGKPLGMDMDR